MFPSRETGAQRASINSKIDTSLVPFELIAMAAVGLNYGAEKYAPRNFEQGLHMSDLLNSIDRHNRALMAGEWTDEDSDLAHIALLASSVAMLCHNVVSGTVVRDIAPRLDNHSVASISEYAQNRLQNRRIHNAEDKK